MESEPDVDGAETSERQQLKGILDRRREMLIEHYREPADEVAAALGTLWKKNIRSRLRRHENESFEQQTFDVDFYFSVEALYALCRVVPRLIEEHARLEAEAMSSASVRLAWQEVEPARTMSRGVPVMQTARRHLDSGAYFMPELSVEGRTRSVTDAAAFRDVSPFELWRSPGLYGFHVAWHERNPGAVARFATELRDLDLSTVSIATLEAAYLAHLSRELHRTAHPFGLAEAGHRDEMVHAISLGFESHVGPWIEKPLTTSDRWTAGQRATELDYAEALDVVVGGPMFHFGRVPRTAPFDVIRAAAAVQGYFGEAEAEPTDGWSPTLSRRAFGDAGSGGAGAGFSERRRVLMPYSDDLGTWLVRTMPVGSIRRLAKRSGHSDADLVSGRARENHYVFETRHEVVEAFYRERVQHEQLGVDEQGKTIQDVQAALRGLLEPRANEALRANSNRPKERSILPFEELSVDEPGAAITALDALSFEHDRLIDSAARAGKAVLREDVGSSDGDQTGAARTGRGEKGERKAILDEYLAEAQPETEPSGWAGEVIFGAPFHIRQWMVASMDPRARRLPADDLRPLKHVEAFVVWLRNVSPDELDKVTFKDTLRAWTDSLPIEPRPGEKADAYDKRAERRRQDIRSDVYGVYRVKFPQAHHLLRLAREDDPDAARIHEGTVLESEAAARLAEQLPGLFSEEPPAS